MKPIDFINKRIALLWSKEPKNANEAHFRAQELTRLQELRDKNYESSTQK